MSQVKNFFNKYIFKKRYVYSLKNTKKVVIGLKGTELIVLKGNSLLEHKELFKDSTIKNKIFERSKNQNIFCLTCIDENKKLVGYFWGIVPNERIWHDSIPIEKDQGFLFNGYVNPESRGNNIFAYLIHEITQYIKRNYQVHEIIDVVETQNIASVKAHNKVNAKIYSNNFLFKFVKRNVFSLYRKKVNLLLGSKRNRI